MADEKINDTQAQMSAEQKAVLKKLSKLMPEAKLFEPRAGGNYYGPIIANDKNFVVQQVGDNTVVAHPKAQLALPSDMKLKVGQVVSVAHAKANTVEQGAPSASLESSDPSRWQERAARTPASAEHTAIAREALGDKFTVSNAPPHDKGLSPTYEGVFAAVTDDHLIQRINSRTAIVHNVGPDVAKQFAAGQEAVVRYDNGRFKDAQAVERSKEQERPRPTRERNADQLRSPDDKARAASWALAKNLVAKSYGSDIKVYSAQRLDGVAGKFRGPIVAMTDHHVVQRVGTSNKFVSHSREDLQGELQTGRFTQINYDHGKAQAQRIQRSQERPQGHAHGQAQGRSNPPPRAPERQPSQGMSR